MTNVEFTLTDGVICFSCKGHAGFAEKGKDIVCAGISALCMALLKRITQLQKEKQTEITECFISDGCLVLHFTLTPKAEECYKTVLCGFEAIAHAYPENCRINLHFSVLCDKIQSGDKKDAENQKT